MTEVTQHVFHSSYEQNNEQWFLLLWWNRDNEKPSNARVDFTRTLSAQS